MVLKCGLTAAIIGIDSGIQFNSIAKLYVIASGNRKRISTIACTLFFPAKLEQGNIAKTFWSMKTFNTFIEAKRIKKRWARYVLVIIHFVPAESIP